MAGMKPGTSDCFAAVTYPTLPGQSSPDTNYKWIGRYVVESLSGESGTRCAVSPDKPGPTWYFDSTYTKTISDLVGWSGTPAKMGEIRWLSTLPCGAPYSSTQIMSMDCPTAPGGLMQLHKDQRQHEHFGGARHFFSQ